MKQKGFTLIELLAVIVILAIIAIIAVPVILNVIEKSKIGAAEQSAEGYIDAVEKQIVTNKVKNENLIEEGEYTKSQLDEKNVKIKGEITDAIVVVGAKGRVTQGRFCINGYSIDYDGKKATKNSESNYCNEMNSIVDTCSYEENQVFNFDYTGNIQEFTPECRGRYKLEVWGAQGGYQLVDYAGTGGYSFGEFVVSNPQTLYVVVGGMGTRLTGTSDTIANGGYNGGGYGQKKGYSGNAYGGSGGGGATHIALRTGLLSTLESYKDDILIVAGGGGGSGYNDGGNNDAAGGYGGGYQGGYGIRCSSGCSGGSTSDYNGVANQTTGYSFGQGEDANRNGSRLCTGGGGGGYYGGRVSNRNTCNDNGGEGGSGYIGNNLLNNKGMYVYNNSGFASTAGYFSEAGCVSSNAESTKTTCTSNYSSTPTTNYAKQGNGYARITYLGKE